MNFLTEAVPFWRDGNVLESFRVGILFVGLIGGIYGLCLAKRRSVTADRNLLRERCQMGLELLSLRRGHYAARVAGASILSDILNGDSADYDKSILRAFEACLFTPSVFGGQLGAHEKGEIDYESRETYLIVNALRRYAKRRCALPMFPLPRGLPFIFSKSTVKPDENHNHYKRWMEIRKKPPDYS